MSIVAFLLAAAVAGPAVAEDQVVNDPPPPTDFSKPFQFDRSPFYGYPFLPPAHVQAQDEAQGPPVPGPSDAERAASTETKAPPQRLSERRDPAEPDSEPPTASK